MSSLLLKKVFQGLIRILGIAISRVGQKDSDTQSGDRIDDLVLNKNWAFAFLILVMLSLGCLFGLLLVESYTKSLASYRTGTLTRSMAQELSQTKEKSLSTISLTGLRNLTEGSHTTGLAQEISIPRATRAIENHLLGSSQCQSPKRDPGSSALNQQLINGCSKASGDGWKEELLRPSFSDKVSHSVRKLFRKKERCAPPVVGYWRQLICRQHQTD